MEGKGAMSNKHVNAVIVGAGAGGGVMAKVLSEAGLSVVLLERGRWQSFHDITDDELISQRSPMLTRAPGPDNQPSRKAHEFDSGRNGVVVPNNAACVGSGTMTYGAMAWRFMPQDFRMKTLYGCPKGSSLDDWPISYDELEPCYERAEWEIGVSGDDTGNPFAPPRKKPRPMPAFPYNREARILIRGMKRLGWHPFPAPVLRNSIPCGGRPACIHERSCVGFACPINAKCGTQNTVIPAALATGCCELRTDAVVSEVMVDGRGHARGVKYFDRNDRLQEQTADVWLCCRLRLRARRASCSIPRPSCFRMVPVTITIGSDATSRTIAMWGARVYGRGGLRGCGSRLERCFL